MANTPVHVNIASDETEGVCVHIALPAAPVGTWPSREVPTEQGQRAGAGKHKITGTVFHRKRGIVLHGHDVGMGIPDEAPPYVGQASGYLPIIMLKSSRKVMFGASTVKAEGTPIGGATRAPGALPMLTCGEPVPLPSVVPTTNRSNTVLVGFSASDVQRGWEDIFEAVAIEAFCFVVSVLTLDALEFGGVDVAAGIFGVDPIKMGLGTASGIAKSAKRSADSGWTEPISFKVEVGGGVEGTGVEVKWTPKTSVVEIGAEKNMGTEKAAAGAKRDEQGKWTGTGAVPPDLFGGDGV